MHIKRHTAGWLITLGLIIAAPALSGCAQNPEAASASDDYLIHGEGGEMLRAAADGNVFKVDKLLSQGANVDARTPDGATALMGAVYYGYQQTSRLLMERGADVNARTDGGVTALHYAAQRGRLEIAKDLLRKGADPDAVSAAGNTPLELARAEGHQDLVDLLQPETGALAPDSRIR